MSPKASLKRSAVNAHRRGLQGRGARGEKTHPAQSSRLPGISQHEGSER